MFNSVVNVVCVFLWLFVCLLFVAFDSATYAGCFFVMVVLLATYWL